MTGPDSALKLFLKHTPDALEHLFDRCISSLCEREQVQGKIFFDFFLFAPPRSSIGAADEQPEKKSLDQNELTLPQILITHGKAYFLLHPLFETFLRLKWVKMKTMFLVHLIFHLFNVMAIIGFALTHYGQFHQENSTSTLKKSSIDFWSGFYGTTSGLFDFLIITNGILYTIPEVKKLGKLRTKGSKWFYMTPVNILLMFMDTILMLGIMSIPFLVLFAPLEKEMKRYLLAIDVIGVCFTFMRMICQLPDVGIYIFMMKRVFTTILRFFSIYFWHFFGYAVAFHIIMPQSEAFANLGDSLIKVLHEMPIYLHFKSTVTIHIMSERSERAMISFYE